MTRKNSTKQRFSTDLMKGQVALVTGAGTGMGKVTALEMASCGAKIVIIGRRLEPLEETVQQICAEGGEAFCLTCEFLYVF